MEQMGWVHTFKHETADGFSRYRTTRIEACCRGRWAVALSFELVKQRRYRQRRNEVQNAAVALLRLDCCSNVLLGLGRQVRFREATACGRQFGELGIIPAE